MNLFTTLKEQITGMNFHCRFMLTLSISSLNLNVACRWYETTDYWLKNCGKWGDFFSHGKMPSVLEVHKVPLHIVSLWIILFEPRAGKKTYSIPHTHLKNVHRCFPPPKSRILWNNLSKIFQHQQCINEGDHRKRAVV